MNRFIITIMIFYKSTRMHTNFCFGQFHSFQISLWVGTAGGGGHIYVVAVHQSWMHEIKILMCNIAHYKLIN